MAGVRQEFDNGIKVDGNSAFTNTVTFSNNVTIAGDLAVSGNLTFSATSYGNIIPSSTTFSLGNTTNRWHLLANTGAFTGNVTFSAFASFAAANSTSSSLRINMGVAPSTVANGDVWANSTGLYFHTNSTSRQLAFTTSNISGSSNTANAWSAARTLSLTGDVTGNVSIDGSTNVSLATTIGATLSGKTFTGNISVQGDASSFTSTVSNGVLSVARSAGSLANTNLDLYGGAALNSRRWSFVARGDGALDLSAFNDAGSSANIVFQVARTGVVNFLASPTVDGNTIWHAANDGTGSGLDADLLDGQQGSFYSNATNLTTGTVPAARLGGTYDISISGTANNATNLNGQAASYYTDIPTRLGYTPVNKAGDSVTGNVNFTLSATNTGIGASYSDGGRTGWFGLPGSANSFALYDTASNNYAISFNRGTNLLTLANTVATFNMVRENRNTLTISAGAVSANIANANFFEITLSNNITTVSYQNLPASGTIQMWVLKVNIGGSYTITWPAAVKWAGGLTPTLPTGSGNSATIVQYTTDGGTKIHSFYSGPTN